MQTLADILISRAEESPTDISFVELDRRGRESEVLTYLSLFDRAASIAGCIQGSCRQGAHVIIVIPHGLTFIVAFYGCLLAKCVAVPYRVPKPTELLRLISVLKTANIEAVLTIRSLEAKLREILSEGELKIPLIFVDEIDSNCASDWRSPTFLADDHAIIQFTSGTTRAPKGIAITHGALSYNSEAIRCAFEFQVGHTVVSWLPFTHDMGLIGHVVQPVYSGLRSVFMSPFAFVSDPSNWLRAIANYRGYCSGAPNFAYRLCCDKVSTDRLDDIDLSSWKLAYCGSERIEPTTAISFIEKFKRCGFSADSFYPCYGLAESTLFVVGRHGLKTSTNPLSGARGASVGKAVGGTVQLRIIDPDTQRESSAGQVGEIWIRSPSNAVGYYGEIGFTEYEVSCTENLEGGFVRSGDLGYFDNGELYIVGRIKDVIKIRGLAFAAEDIEVACGETASELGLCIYGIAAISVLESDEEKIVVLIEVDKSLLDNDLDMCERIRKSICDQLTIVIAAVSFVPRNALPKTTSGKVKRSLCEKVYFALRNGSLIVHKEQVIAQ